MRTVLLFIKTCCHVAKFAFRRLSRARSSAASSKAPRGWEGRAQRLSLLQGAGLSLHVLSLTWGPGPAGRPHHYLVIMRVRSQCMRLSFTAIHPEEK